MSFTSYIHNSFFAILQNQSIHFKRNSFTQNYEMLNLELKYKIYTLWKRGSFITIYLLLFCAGNCCHTNVINNWLSISPQKFNQFLWQIMFDLSYFPITHTKFIPHFLQAFPSTSNPFAFFLLSIFIKASLIGIIWNCSQANPW